MSAGPIMKPARLPEDVRADPKLSAECRVYDALESSASLAGAVVYHSRRWHADVNGMRRDGEIDFLVAHPEWGFLSLEVKGGRIGFDAGGDSWTSTDRHGVEHGITNPFRQAEKSKRVVLDYLREHWPGRRMPFVNARHGVIFPHSEGRGRLSGLPAYAPPEIVACTEHMDKLGSRVAAMMIRQGAETRSPTQPFGSVGMEVIDGFAGRDVDLAPLPETRVRTVDRQIVELTETQTRYLTLLQHQPVAVVEGGAGTGKTMLAMEQARRWAEKHGNTLLLCFNDPLAKAMAGALADAPLGVSTFHKFCERTAAAHGIDMIAEKRSYPKGWLDRLPDHLETVALDGPGTLYDAVIIDEAQDFRAEWIEALRMFVASEGRFWCFRDDGQNVQFGDDLLNVLDVHPFALNENIRNARPVFDAAQPYRVGPAQSCLGPEGPDVEIIETAADRVIKTVGRTVNRLLTADGIGPEGIAVLVETRTRADAVAAALSRKDAVGAAEAWSDGLVIDTVRRFKGLDRPVVVLATRHGEAAMDYVGHTRARGRLIVIRETET